MGTRLKNLKESPHYGSVAMFYGTCVTNHNGDVGYIISLPFQNKDNKECFVRVIWMDPLLRAVNDNQLYPRTLTITNEMETDLNC